MLKRLTYRHSKHDKHSTNCSFSSISQITSLVVALTNFKLCYFADCFELTNTPSVQHLAPVIEAVSDAGIEVDDIEDDVSPIHTPNNTSNISAGNTKTY